jgi:hypothetical protein
LDLKVEFYAAIQV